MTTRELTVIAKVTNDCNLSCKYCYMEPSTSKSTMDKDTLEIMLDQISDVNTTGHTEVIWHGGEPLRAGLDFFENAAYIEALIKFQKNHRFTNGIQTNGVLVTPKLIDFCKKNKFSLGFSLDGPLEIHGKTRQFKDGRNSFNEAYRGLKLAQEARVGGGAIVVVNKTNYEHLIEIYEFFKENNLGLKLNPLIRSGQAKLNMGDLGINPTQYADSMISLFDHYFNDKEMTRGVDPFDIWMGNVAMEQARGCCAFGKNCTESFISVSPVGDVYPCGRFDGIKDFYFGNIHEQHLFEILKSPVRQKLLKRTVENVKGCDCEYKPICNSGCLNNAYMVRGNFMDKDYYCEAYKKIFKHIEGKVNEELNKVAIENGK